MVKINKVCRKFKPIRLQGNVNRKELLKLLFQQLHISTHGEELYMDFIRYLQMRHEVQIGQKEMNAISARQYNNRLINMKKKKIYNDESYLDEQMLGSIKNHYKDKSNDYPRTIKYYIEFLNNRSLSVLNGI